MRTSAARIASLVMMLGIACNRSDARRAADSAALARETIIVPGQYTLDDFRLLRWLEGRWRGFRPDGDTFYERYRFLDDSTLAMVGFTDSTFTKVSDSSRVLLRGGIVSNDRVTARWLATRLDSTGVDFAPDDGATNHFTWAQESPTKWNATLRWTDRDGRAQSVVYALHKFGR